MLVEECAEEGRELPVGDGDENMPQTITLTLPNNVLQPVQRVVQATKQWVEELLVTALQAALPTLEGLPSGVV
jgi:hypothetical protein